MKKKGLIIICLAMILLVGCSFWGDKEGIIEGKKENVIQITFPKSLVRFVTDQNNKQELMEWLEENGQDNYIDLNAQDGSIYMNLTLQQLENWKKYINDKINEEEEKLKNISTKYHNEISEDYKKISLYYDINAEFIPISAIIGRLEIYCSMNQIFNGIENWVIDIKIYNSDTGKLVNEKEQVDKVEYDNSAWKRSYKLNREEEKQLLNYDKAKGCEGFKFKINTIPAIEALEIFGTICEDDYTYRYINNDGEVVLGFTNEQKEEAIDKCGNYIDEIKTQFESLNSLYELKVDEDFSKLEMSFNSELEDQEQGNYVGYTATSYMLMRALRGESDINFEYNIYNCDSGNLVAKGNTKDGMSFSVKE